MKLVLFDIDGTLLWSDGAGRRAMEGALVEIFGTPGHPDYRYDGKTDPQIADEQMAMAGFDDARRARDVPRALGSYLARLQVEVAREEGRPRLFAGVEPLLVALETRDDVLVGLLTGNVADGARVKLGAAGLDFDRFAVGAFGSDHRDRGELPAIARARAARHAGRDFDGGQVVIVGDTPHDVYCGQGIGARALAVATGRYSRDELAECDPAAVLDDLADTAAVLAAIDRVTA